MLPALAVVPLVVSGPGGITIVTEKLIEALVFIGSLTILGWHAIDRFADQLVEE